MQQNKNDLLNYSKTPITEWIATYLRKNVKSIFPDHTGETKILSTIVHKKNYVIKLAARGRPTERENINNMDFSQAIVVLYDAVINTFGLIVYSSTVIEEMKGLMPVFNEDTLMFSFRRFNHLAVRKEVLYNNIAKAQQRMRTESKIAQEEIIQYIRELNTITDEKLKEIDSNIIAVNKELEKGPYLQIEIRQENVTDAKLLQNKLLKITPQFNKIDKDLI